MLLMTEKAAKATKRFIKYAEEPFKGLRVAVTGGGCSGFQYDIQLATAPSEGDSTMEVEGITIFLDQTSAPLVDGMTIDFKESLTDSGFIFHNPNASASCGCGKSFQV
jgi:iron-sulfur cluster assembly accessory protein